METHKTLMVSPHQDALDRQNFAALLANVRPINAHAGTGKCR